MTELCSTAEYAKILGCHPNTVKKLLATGCVPGAFKLTPSLRGGRWRIPRNARPVRNDPKHPDPPKAGAGRE